MFATKFAMVLWARRIWMGQSDRSRTNRPKEAAVNDETKKSGSERRVLGSLSANEKAKAVRLGAKFVSDVEAHPDAATCSEAAQGVDRPKWKALLDFWVKRWKKNREIAVFSHTEEASDSGLPTLATMSELARRLTGVNVVHYGFGCFGAKTYKGEEIFGFCGGGAMQQDPAIDCSYTILTIRKESRRLVIKILREIAPGGFEALAKEDAARKAERAMAKELKETAAFEASQKLGMKEATDLWNKANEDDEKRDKAQRELLRAAREVLKDMNAIGAHDEPSVVRLQKAVSNKALKS